MLRRTCAFASGGICGSHSAFRCILGTIHQSTIFMLGWDRYGFKKKCAGKSYTEIVFLPPVGYASHVVHSSASWAQNVNAVFFMLGWAQCGFHKKCILVHPGHETSMHHFSSSGGPDAVSIKSAPVHIT
jgi:hypothetical protein